MDLREVMVYWGLVIDDGHELQAQLQYLLWWKVGGSGSKQLKGKGSRSQQMDDYRS